MELFSKRLKEMRQFSAQTQKHIAQSINISERSYIDLETGKFSPSAKTLIAIANYFDCSLDWLCGRNDNPDSHTFTLAWKKDFDKIMTDIAAAGAVNPKFGKFIEKYFDKLPD
jgi:DNA-binding XRE family transcriptional regulator